VTTQTAYNGQVSNCNQREDKSGWGSGVNWSTHGYPQGGKSAEAPMGIHKVADKALGIILKASLPSLIALSGVWW